VAFGLTKSGVLYANSRILVRNCTSLAVTSAHLIFTTTQHLLKFVHLVGADGTYKIRAAIDQLLTMGRVGDTLRRATKG
jgi:ABC-type enterochelin transport system ATPase subunit